MQAIRLGGQHEVAFAQSIDRVRPDGELHLSPGEKDVGVVVLLFSEFADFVGEVEGLAEIGEFELAFEMMLGDDCPRGDVELEARQIGSLERWDGAFAWEAFLLR